MKLKSKRDAHICLYDKTGSGSAVQCIESEPGYILALNLDDFEVVDGYYDEWMQCGMDLKRVENKPESKEKDWKEIKRLSKKLREYDESREPVVKKVTKKQKRKAINQALDVIDEHNKLIESKEIELPKDIYPEKGMRVWMQEVTEAINANKKPSKEIEMPPIFIDVRGDHVDSDNKLNLWMEQVTSAINSMRREND